MSFTLLTLLMVATGGKLDKVEHFDTKAAVAEYIRSIDLPASYYLPGFYMSNLPGGMLRKGDDGKYVFALPVDASATIPLIDIEKDTGTFVKAILLNRDESLGKEYFGAVDYYTPQRVVDEFIAAYPQDGKGTSFHTLPDGVYKGILGSMGMPEKVQEELLQNMQLLGKEYGYYAGADVKATQKVSRDGRSRADGRSLGNPSFPGRSSSRRRRRSTGSSSGYTSSGRLRTCLSRLDSVMPFKTSNPSRFSLLPCYATFSGVG